MLWSTPFTPMTCPFCAIIRHEAPADEVARTDGALAIRPLNPVVPGHIIVMPTKHVPDALAEPMVTALTMKFACEVSDGQCNIITSVGPKATQSIGHLHIHIVPRRWEDGLLLPWGDNEKHHREYEANAYAFYNGER